MSNSDRGAPDERKKFEATVGPEYCKRYQHKKSGDEDEIINPYVTRDYENPRVDAYWKIWQAAYRAGAAQTDHCPVASEGSAAQMRKLNAECGALRSDCIRLSAELAQVRAERDKVKPAGFNSDREAPPPDLDPRWEGCICLQDEHHRNCPAIQTGKCHYQSLYGVDRGAPDEHHPWHDDEGLNHELAIERNRIAAELYELRVKIKDLAIFAKEVAGAAQNSFSVDCLAVADDLIQEVCPIAAWTCEQDRLTQWAARRDKIAGIVTRHARAGRARR